MDLENKIATVFGGTGFIGRYIIAQLAKKGATVKVVTRHPQSAYFLRQFGVVGQIVPFFCDYSQSSIDHAVAGSDVVVNCLGILFEKGKSKFKTVHEDDAGLIAQSCAHHGVKRFVHISALGVDTAKSRYGISKRAGENIVRSAFKDTIIMRPGIVFGPEDNFFNKFAKLSMLLPALPVIGGGVSRFQPVYVGDVADAVLAALQSPEIGDASALGKTYELGGPEILTFKEIYQKLLTQTGRRRLIFNMPEALARLQAVFLSILPTPPLTSDQITSLKTDAIVNPLTLTLSDLGIQATALDSVLPGYLDQYRPGGRFAAKKAIETKFEKRA